MITSRTAGRLLSSARTGRHIVPNIIQAGHKLGSVRHPLSLSQDLPTYLIRHATTPVQRCFTTFSPQFATSPPPLPGKEPPKAESEPESEGKWIAILENTAHAPWLPSLHPDLENRLKLAYTLLFQIALYLGRPMESQQADQFLITFGTAPVSSESEMGRARAAIASITRAIVHQVSSIPINSPLRTNEREIFDVFDELQAIHDMYLLDDVTEFKRWIEFWPRAQPVVFEFGIKLDEKGYGFSIEELKELEKKESETQ